MKDNYTKFYIVVASFIVFLLGINIFIWILIIKYNTLKRDKEIDNTIKLESIKNGINEKDSIINDYKIKFEYEKEKIANANDSDIINQFKSYISK